METSPSRGRRPPRNQCTGGILNRAAPGVARARLHCRNGNRERRAGIRASRAERRVPRSATPPWHSRAERAVDDR